MTTLVGTQDDFSKAMIELLKLEYDANDAYVTAIEKLKDSVYKAELSQFKLDHDRHLMDLTSLLNANNITPPHRPDLKGLLAKGKVFFGSLMGDIAILKAMQTNEVDTNTAYERMNKHEGKWLDATEILQRGWDDEIRHKAWLEQVIATNKS